MKLNVLFFLLIVLLASCETETDRIQERLQPFLGEFEVSGSQVNGIIPNYDNEGNPIGTGLDTVYFENDVITVSILEGTDSLIVEGLLTLHNLTAERRKTVVGFIDGNVVRWNIDSTDQYNKRIYTGELTILRDQIIANYFWDLSSFNSVADPFYGTVEAEGNRR